MTHTSESELLCDSQFVSQSVLALSPSGTHDQILAVVKTVAGLMSWGVFPEGRMRTILSSLIWSL